MCDPSLMPHYTAAEDLTWPPQMTRAKAQDHLAVSALWNQMQRLLSGPPEQMDTFIRQLNQLLPPLACVPAHALPGIARIHLQSTTHLKATMRLLAPKAFEGCSDTADSISLAGFVARLPPSAEPMVLRLIDLQILHLSRAQNATAQMRMHARLRSELQSVLGPATSDIAAAVAAAVSMDAAVAATSTHAAAGVVSPKSAHQQQQQDSQQQQQQQACSSCRKSDLEAYLPL